MQRVYPELVLSTEGPMLHQHVVQSPDLAHSRHENQDSRRIARIRRILKAYSLKQAEDEIVGDETFVQEIDSRDRLWRVTLLKSHVFLLCLVLVVIFTGRGVFCPLSSLVTVEFILA